MTYNRQNNRERFLEIFQSVNKIKINEDVNWDSKSLIDKYYTELSSKRLNVANTNTYVDDDETMIEMTAVAESGDNIEFTFKVIVDDSEFDDVVSIQDVELVKFVIKASGGNDVVYNEDDLVDFNSNYGKGLYNVIKNYFDFDENKPELDTNDMNEHFSSFKPKFLNELFD